MMRFRAAQKRRRSQDPAGACRVEKPAAANHQLVTIWDKSLLKLKRLLLLERSKLMKMASSNKMMKICLRMKMDKRKLTGSRYSCKRR